MKTQEWKTRLEYGHKGELIVEQYLRKLGFEILFRSTELKDPDLIIGYYNSTEEIYDDNGNTNIPIEQNTRIIEVKRDHKCTYTGNIAVELNDFGELSCIGNSINANTIVYVIDKTNPLDLLKTNHEEKYTLIFISTNRLINLLNSKKYKFVQGGYKNNSNLILVSKKDIMEHANKVIEYIPDLKEINKEISKNTDKKFYNLKERK